MSQRPNLEISLACLPRHPAVAYLFLVRRYFAHRQIMTKEEQAALRNEVSEAFNKNLIDTATPEQLQIWLKTLSTTRSKFYRNHPRDIIRALRINHVQNSNFIRKLDRENRWIHKWILGLTALLLVFTVCLIVLTVQLKEIARTDNSIESISRQIKTFQESPRASSLRHQKP